MKGYELFPCFGIWVMWFIVFSLIIRREREVGVEDVSGLNDDISFDNKACCSNQQDLFRIDKGKRDEDRVHVCKSKGGE